MLIQTQINCQNTDLATPQMSIRGDPTQCENDSDIMQTPLECVRHRLNAVIRTLRGEHWLILIEVLYHTFDYAQVHLQGLTT